jgi:hypothetical protein
VRQPGSIARPPAATLAAYHLEANATVVVNVVDLLLVTRPFRGHVDPAQEGAEVVSGVANRVRAERPRNMGLGDLLKPLSIGSGSDSSSRAGTTRKSVFLGKRWGWRRFPYPLPEFGQRIGVVSQGAFVLQTGALRTGSQRRGTL